MTNHISIKIKIEDEKLLKTLFQSLEIESEQMQTQRGNLLVQSQNNFLELKINVEDLVAARAYTNSILRLLKTSIEVAEVLE